MALGLAAVLAVLISRQDLEHEELVFCQSYRPPALRYSGSDCRFGQAAPSQGGLVSWFSMSLHLRPRRRLQTTTHSAPRALNHRNAVPCCQGLPGCQGLPCYQAAGARAGWPLQNAQGRRLYRCGEIRSLIAQQVHGDACVHAYSYYGISVSLTRTRRYEFHVLWLFKDHL